MKQIIKTLDFHHTIKLTAEESKEEINFLDVNVRLKNMQLETDRRTKSTEAHQFPDLTFCHPYHWKKGVHYSQGSRCNRFSSDNEKFDQSCKDKEKK